MTSPDFSCRHKDAKKKKRKRKRKGERKRTRERKRKRERRSGDNKVGTKRRLYRVIFVLVGCGAKT